MHSQGGRALVIAGRTHRCLLDGGGASTAPAPRERSASDRAARPAAAPPAGCKVGVSWNNFKEERWAKWDEPSIKEVVEGAGGTYVGTDAGSSAEKQATDVEQLITDGAKVIIILAQDGTAIQPTVQAAVDQGIPVIAYDRLIENEKAFYITFDNPLVGQLMAEEIIKVVPKGNYVIIKGNSADANSDFLRAGIEKVIGASVDVRRHQDRRRGLHRQLGCGHRADHHGAVPDRREQRDRRGARAERRHGRRRRRGAQGPGPRWQGPGHGAGRRQGGPEPRRARHPARQRRQGRSPARRRGRQAPPSRSARAPPSPTSPAPSSSRPPRRRSR